LAEDKVTGIISRLTFELEEKHREQLQPGSQPPAND